MINEKAELTTSAANANPYLRKNITAREMTVIGMLAAITMLLGLTGYGFIPLPFMKATILHVPTIIGALLEGPRVGMIVGFLFGCFSLIQNVMMPSLMSFAFLNPLVSVLPRVLIGPFAFAVYKLLPLRREAVRVGIAAFLGSVVNTIMVLGMIYVLYASSYAETQNIPQGNVLNILAGVAIVNGIPEALLCALIATPVVLMVRKAVKKDK